MFREEYIRFYNSCDNSLFPIQGGFLLYQAPEISEYNSKTDPDRAKQIKEQAEKFFEIYLSE